MRPKNGFILIIGALLLFGSATFGSTKAKSIKIGAVFDITGPTGDVGWHYADGVRDYFKWLNASGGIHDVKIRLEWKDCQYDIPQTLSAYEKFVKDDHVKAIIGWGTGDSEALRTKIIKDKIPYISASFAQNLVWIPGNWNFIPATTYADHVRTVLKYINNLWKENRPLRVALIYNDSEYGRAVLAPAKRYAKAHGIKIVDEEKVSLRCLDATPQMRHLKQKKADYAYIQETVIATATILKDAGKLGLTTLFTGNFWGTERKLAELAGPAAEGYIGVMPFAIWSDRNVPGIQLLKKINRKYHPRVQFREPPYVAGWVNAAIMTEAVRKALGMVNNDPNQVTGTLIKKGFESIKDFNIEGLVTPVSYSAKDHRGAKDVKLVIIKKGRLTAITGWIKTPPVPKAEMEGKE
ncbi:leucine-specific-binding protein precursor [bacterium BMS3Abin05]|nr:leucine-specific-binding protein precursor [bacterium BMS3Abin05]